MYATFGAGGRLFVHRTSGMHIKTFPGLKYKSCYTTPSAGFAPNITIVDEVAAVPLGTPIKGRIASMQKMSTNLPVFSTTPFSARLRFQVPLA